MSNKSVYDYNLELISSYSSQSNYLLQIAKKAYDLKKFSGLSTFTSKSKYPTISYLNQYIHSPYDPIREANRYINSTFDLSASIYFIFGLGFAYHVNSLLEKISEDTVYVIIFELSEAIFSFAFHYISFDFICDKRVLLFVGDKAFDYFQSMFAVTSPMLNFKTKEIIFLESEYRLFKKPYSTLLDNVHRFISDYLQNQFTYFEFEKLWLKNMISNASNLFRHFDVSYLFGLFKSFAAVIISAGPSLRSYIPFLKKNIDKLFIFATDTALPLLLKADISPDFIISVDCQFYNLKDFYNIIHSKNKPFIFYDLSCYYKIIKLFDDYNNKLFYFSAIKVDGEIHPFVEFLSSNYRINITNINCSISVSSAAIEIVRLMGFESILLLGQDLSYSDFSTHCINSAFYDNIAFSSTRTESLDTLFYRNIRASSPRILDGRLTNLSFVKLRDWIEAYDRLYPGILSVPDSGGGHFLRISSSNLDFFTDVFLSFDKGMFIRNLMDGLVFFDKNDFLVSYVSFLNKLENRIYDFSCSILTELRSEDISLEYIEEIYDSIVRSFGFISRFYVKDRFWFYRKKNYSKYFKSLYLNTLLSSSNFLLKLLRKKKL